MAAERVRRGKKVVLRWTLHKWRLFPLSSIGWSNLLPRARLSVPLGEMKGKAKLRGASSIPIRGRPSNSCSTLSCCYMTGPWRTKTVSRSSAPILSLPRPLYLSIHTRRTLTYSIGPMDVTAVSASFDMSSVRSGWTDPSGSKSVQLTRRASTCQCRTPGRYSKNE
jgi:hypothetical protein